MKFLANAGKSDIFCLNGVACIKRVHKCGKRDANFSWFVDL